MPLLTRVAIKTALGYLVAALGVGILLTPVGLERFPLLAAAVPSQVHLLVLGWLTQLIFGVAFWLFPRFTKERPHGNERLAWSGYAMLNAGLLLRILTEPTAAESGLESLVVASAILQWLGCCAWVGQLWPRVREK
jgi:hypothetical protein